MNVRRSNALACTLVGFLAIANAGVVPSFADEPPKTEAPKPKKHRVQTTLQTKAPTPEQLYQAPLELNMDPLKSALLKSEPVIPYQPAIPILPPVLKAGDDSDKAHLAPLLRETSIPESFGDKGSFIDRHEFGIQLRDHF
jgi:hypothetical protein